MSQEFDIHILDSQMNDIELIVGKELVKVLKQQHETCSQLLSIHSEKCGLGEIHHPDNCEICEFIAEYHTI